jgi:hypothetical protein
MAAGTIRVTGLRETTAALRKVSRNAPKVVTDELKGAAEPVRAAAAARISRYQGSRPQSIKPRVKGRGSVFVQQNARKKTGKRGDFGNLQQRHLEAALDQNKDRVRVELEKAMDKLTSSEF